MVAGYNGAKFSNALTARQRAVKLGWMADENQNRVNDDYVRQFMPPERRSGVVAAAKDDPADEAPTLEASASEQQPDSEQQPEVAEPATAEARPADDSAARVAVVDPDLNGSAAAVAVPEPPALETSGSTERAFDRSAPLTQVATDAPVPVRETGEPAYVEANDLFKIYKPADLEVVALRGVDLAIAPGELIGIVGASGSGKTTLLNILAGLERPSAGRIRVGERDLLDISDSELVVYRRREVGFVWQATGRNLVPYLNVRDNIELPQAIAGTGKPERRERAAELLEALQMPDKARRYPSELSGGEQQRVAIAVALANNPPLLLADEPTGELDTNMAEEVFRMLQRINRRFGVTVIIVTHYAGIARWVDRVVRIRDGRIGSESYLASSYRGDEGQEREYLVVDRAGRLQLPREFVERLAMDGLASAGITEDGGSITLRPATAPHRSRNRDDGMPGESGDGR